MSSDRHPIPERTMYSFADAAVQGTRGDRGKTTRRKSTRTVRGSEGAWIAQCKEELASRPAGWVVREERVWTFSWKAEPESRVSGCGGRFETREDAEAYAATVATGPATLRHNTAGLIGSNYVARVWVEREAK